MQSTQQPGFQHPSGGVQRASRIYPGELSQCLKWSLKCEDGNDSLKGRIEQKEKQIRIGTSGSLPTWAKKREKTVAFRTVKLFCLIL